jgi:hypothetical protein
MTRIGCRSIVCIISGPADGVARQGPEDGLTPSDGVPYALSTLTFSIRTWWAWRRERSGSVAC